MVAKENTIPLNHVAARPPAGSATQKGKTRNGPPRRFLVIGAIVAVLGLFFGVRYWMYASTHEDTDDAYVTGNTHQISSRITGTVEQLLVDDNWHVTAGQPLLKLDPRDYQVALTQARANYSQAKAQLVQANTQIPLAEAQLAQAQAQADSSKTNSDYLERTFERNSQLFYQGRGATPMLCTLCFKFTPPFLARALWHSDSGSLRVKSSLTWYKGSKQQLA